MDESEKQQYEATAQELRAELKRFEGDWAKQNGTKPGRADIKNNPDIAQKYKEYNQVRDILAGKKQPPKPKAPSRSKKRHPEDGVIQTPSKRSRPAHQTPSKSRRHDEEEEEISFETPLRRLFSPAMPTSIGPTPQKDGRVLGLFDLLEDTIENTPSKARSHELSGDNVQVQATPSKQRTAGDDSDDVDDMKLGRTPMSSSKRAMLNTFMTPLKSRDNNAGGKTPVSVSKIQFSTPSFLRRGPPPSLDEDGSWKTPPPRLPRKPLGRSLSSVVASLRKIEEENMDDDLEALHEMENENSAPTRKPAAEPTKPSNDEVLEPDSQRPQLLGGFDDEALYDSPTEEAVGRDGLPLRVYKKKGQKRTTRRVNMKPTRAKRPQQTEEAGAEEENAEDGAADVVPETQLDATEPGNSDPLDLGSDSEFNESEDEGESKPQKKQPKRGSKKNAGKDDKKSSEKNDEDDKPKKAGKKVNPMAHANFKRLKLKNHGAKGGPGVNSRFRRRK